MMGFFDKLKQIYISAMHVRVWPNPLLANTPVSGPITAT